MKLFDLATRRKSGTRILVTEEQLKRICDFAIQDQKIKIEKRKQPKKK